MGLNNTELGEELEKAIEVKQKRWKSCKYDCIRQIQTSLAHTQIPYNSGNVHHQQMLMQLWYVLEFVIVMQSLTEASFFFFFKKKASSVPY